MNRAERSSAFKIFLFLPSINSKRIGEFEGREDYLLVALETIDSNISNYIYEFNYEIDATDDNKISSNFKVLIN